MLLGPVPVFKEGRQIVDTFALVRETEGLLSHVCLPYGDTWPVLNYKCFLELYTFRAEGPNMGIVTPMRRHKMNVSSAKLSSNCLPFFL